jgi:iron-sulfur cluster repair protein YtfE (RIC family)
MDAFDFIKQDHEKFRKMFKEFEEAGDRAYKTKQDIATRLFDELAAHETMEEEIFYPAIKESASSQGKELVLEGFEEHHVADEIIAELKELDPEAENYDAKFKVLQENVEHHLDEEESDLFPEAREALGDRADEIGEQLQARKKELMSGNPAATR